MRLPEKGSSATSPIPGPAETATFEPAFSDEDEEEGQPNPAAAATAAGLCVNLGARTEAASSSADAAVDVFGES